MNKLQYNTKMTLGQKLRKIRESKNYTQDYVASRLGVTQQAYQKIESDETKIDGEKLGKLLTLLDVTVNDFVSWDGNIFHNCNQYENYFSCEINRSIEKERELYEKLLEAKNEVINTQKLALDVLLKGKG